jgi:uncharacterized protein with HEPN domain
MFSDEERVREWLGHIVENADRALSYTAGLDYEGWSADPMRVDAVERCLMRLTEAAIRISDERMARIAPDLAFHQVRGLGSMLRHKYDALDLKRLWRTVTEALPPLRTACLGALS